MKNNIHFRFSAGLAAIALGLVASASYAQNAQESASENIGVGEIIVTAQKREQNLQDVPVSVVALNEDVLRNARVTSFMDIATNVPNLVMIPGNSGAKSPTMAMRGAYISIPLPGQDRPVAFYQDGVWLGSTIGGGFEVPAIERIEVLRGPQGTLFGRNSTAGAVTVTTPDPKGEWAGDITLTAGNYSQQGINAKIHTPSIGPLSAMVAYRHTQRHGDIKNLGAGMIWDFTTSPGGPGGMRVSSARLGDDEVDALLLGLKFEPSDSFKAVYKFDWMHNTWTAPGNGLLWWDPSTLANGALVTAQSSASAANITATTINLRRPKALNNGWVTPSSMTTQGHNLTTYWDVADRTAIKGIFSYRKGHSVAFGQFGPLLVDTAGTIAGGIGNPWLLFGLTVMDSNKQYSGEVQLTHQADAFTLTAGVTYLNFKTVYFNNQASKVSGTTVSGNKLNLPDNRRFNTTKSLGAYAQAEIHVTDALDLVVGGRITNDKKDAQNLNPGRAPDFSHYSSTDPTLAVGANYKINDDVMLYGKYDYGYLAGGSFSGVEFKKTVVTSAELGLKSQFLDDRVRFNLALFDAKYKNLQERVQGTNLTPSQPLISAAIVTLGDVKARGFEAELTVVPVRGLSLAGGLGYLDTKVSRIDPAFPIAVPRFTQRPKWSANWSATYETDPIFGEASLMFNINGNYVSSFLSPVVVPGGVPVAALSQFNKTLPLTLYNGRVALQNIDLGFSKVELALWAKNLFDNKRYNLPAGSNRNANAAGATGRATWIGSQYVPARTVGVDFNVTF